MELSTITGPIAAGRCATTGAVVVVVVAVVVAVAVVAAEARTLPGLIGTTGVGTIELRGVETVTIEPDDSIVGEGRVNAVTIGEAASLLY